MSKHLSEDQIARCVVSQATHEELQHSRGCPECAARLKGFNNAVSLFQNAIHERIDSRIAVGPAFAISKPAGVGRQTQRWVLVAAAAVGLVVLPFIRTGSKPEELPEPIATESDADAVMNRVNQHLAQSVPAPMQPLLMGVPDMNP